jgi:hypothetical protein
MDTGVILLVLLAAAAAILVILRRRSSTEGFADLPTDGLCWVGQVPVVFRNDGTNLRSYKDISSAQAWIGQPKVAEIIARGNATPVPCVTASVLYGKQFSTKQMPDKPVPAVCKVLGRPSPDNSIRIYTPEECAILGGRFDSKKGECLKPTEGSFSYECRALNDPAGLAAAQGQEQERVRLEQQAAANAAAAEQARQQAAAAEQARQQAAAAAAAEQARQQAAAAAAVPAPAPAPAPIVAQISPAVPPSIPAECGTLGYPKQDKKIRLYSKRDCASLGGKWYRSGECLKRQGGSFSASCAELNNQPTPAAAYTDFEGKSIKCDETGAVYRFEGGQRRLYPTPEIAASWDRRWASAPILDCINLPEGIPMVMKPAVAARRR